MKSYTNYLKSFLIFITLNITLTQASVVLEITDGCDLPDSPTTNYLHLTAEGSVLYKSSYNIGGFQFNTPGATINSASGGDAASAGLIVQSMGDMVLGFSMSGSSIPAGCGTLTNLSLSGSTSELTGIIMSDATGGQLYFEYYYGEIEGCTDISACNYNSDATIDDGSCLENDCAGECGGSAVEDECGICDGDNSTCLDCAGVPNGDAELDNCGVCNGGNADDLGCGCFQPGPSGCDNTCGSDLVDDECGVCGGDNSSCDEGCGPNEPGPSGCDNTCGSVLENDECGVCGGDNSS